jgi:DNA polymerase-3 subunit epsilon
MKKFNDYAVIDVETSGLHPENEHRITSVSAIKVRGNQMHSRFFSLINPGVHISPQVESITGLSNQLLQNAPIGSEVFPKFLSFVGELPVISHDAEFDKKFLENEFHRLNLNCHLNYNDTMMMAKNLFPGESCSINSLLDKLNIKSESINEFFGSEVKNIYQIYESMKHVF